MQGAKYYLCPIQNNTISSKKFYQLNEMLSIDYPPESLLLFRVDEHVFVLQHTEEALLPYEFSIASINRTAKTLVLRVTSIFQHALPLAALTLLLSEYNLQNYTQLTSQQVVALISLMNTLPLEHSPTPSPVVGDENGTHVQEMTLADMDQFAKGLDSLVEQLSANTRMVEQSEDKSTSLSNDSLDAFTTTLQTGLERFEQFEEQRLQFSTRSLETFTDALQVGLARIEKLANEVHTFLVAREDPTPSDPEPEDDGPDPDYDENGRIKVVVAPDEPEEIFEETQVLDYVRDYIRKRGYYFEDETLYNYHICLKTRPFVILAGLSGTGKSKLAQLYAEAMGQDTTFKRLPVRPNWNDDRYLLGYLNTVTGEYITEPAVEFVLTAIHNPQQLYSLCLDEMNLAHVEYYFSQFLSAMEGDRPEERRIELMSQRAYAQLHELFREQRKQRSLPPSQIYLPDNLVFTGTINVDETTQPISDKVIDRANTIEFFNVNLDAIPRPGNPGDALPISNRAWQSYRATQADTSYRPQIVEINTLLKQADMGLGYRVVHEIELYLANSQGLLEPQVAFDLQCKQRILPRIRGTEVIEGTLQELINFSKKHKLPRTERRLQEMKSRLKRDGYTSFWR